MYAIWPRSQTTGSPRWLETYRKNVSIRTNKTNINEVSNNQEPRQQQGLVPLQQDIQRSKSLQLNTKEKELDTDSNLFQDSDNSRVETEQEVVQAPVQVDEKRAPRLATRDPDAIINQLKLRPTTHNPCMYTVYYKGNMVLVERQRDNLEMTLLCPLEAKTSLDDTNKETNSAQGELYDDSDRTEEVVSGGRQTKNISVPIFAAETIHGPQGSTLQAIRIVTGCLEMDMVIKSGSET